LGVERNPKEAAKWHLLAKAGGVKDDQLEIMVNTLSEADRAEAEKAAEKWKIEGRVPR
jgi:hypothetical protein